MDEAGRPQGGPSPSTGLLGLPNELLQSILATAGMGGVSAAVCCSALAAAFSQALGNVQLAATFLVERFGTASAARHLFAPGIQQALLGARSPATYDATLCSLLKELAARGAEVGRRQASKARARQETRHPFRHPPGPPDLIPLPGRAARSSAAVPGGEGGPRASVRAAGGPESILRPGAAATAAEAPCADLGRLAPQAQHLCALSRADSRGAERPRKSRGVPAARRGAGSGIQPRRTGGGCAGRESGGEGGRVGGGGGCWPRNTRCAHAILGRPV